MRADAQSLKTGTTMQRLLTIVARKEVPEAAKDLDVYDFACNVRLSRPVEAIGAGRAASNRKVTWRGLAMSGRWISVLVLWAGLSVGECAMGQSAPPAPAQSSGGTQNAAPAQSSGAGQAVRTKRRTQAKVASPSQPATQVIPLETAPPSPPTPPAVVARQKAEDERLLRQQQAESAQAAQVTNREVEQAQKQRDAVQREIRIQDAPGPAQTGVVPAAGPPRLPVNADDRIQDAPGPAQTLPPVAPAPANPSTSAPGTPPVAPPEE